ncbi:hypothetical protein CR513_19228, partial [Mucuna pruriens]
MFVVSSTIFIRIMTLKLAKAISNYLKTEYEGSERIKGMQKMKKSETIKEYFDKANRAQEQRRVTRQEGMVEGALLVKHQVGGKMTRKKNEKNLAMSGNVVANKNATISNKNKTRGPKGNYPPCQHCGKMGHSPFKCWRRPDAKCSKIQQQEVDTQVVDQEKEDQLFVATCFSSSDSTES